MSYWICVVQDICPITVQMKVSLWIQGVTSSKTGGGGAAKTEHVPYNYKECAKTCNHHWTPTPSPNTHQPPPPHTHTRIHTHTHSHTGSHAETHTQTNIPYTRAHTHTLAHTHIHTHTHTHTHTLSLTLSLTHTPTHTHTHTLMQMPNSNRSTHHLPRPDSVKQINTFTTSWYTKILEWKINTNQWIGKLKFSTLAQICSSSCYDEIKESKLTRHSGISIFRTQDQRHNKTVQLPLNVRICWIRFLRNGLPSATASWSSGHVERAGPKGNRMDKCNKTTLQIKWKMQNSY